VARTPLAEAYPQQLRRAMSELFPEELWDGASQHGNVQWTPGRLLAAATLMSWDDAQTLRARFDNARDVLGRMFPDWDVPSSYSGFAQALARDVGQLRSRVRSRLQQQIRQACPGRWRTAGWVVFGADGSRFECPRTAANEEGLGCAGKNRTAPQAFHTMLMHLGSGAMWDFRVGPGTDSERRHLEDMAADLPHRSLLVADAGFIGYGLCRRLQAAGVHFLLRVGGNVTLLADKLGGRVERDGQTVWLWPQKQQQGPPLVLRLIVVGRGARAVYLATDVLDPQRLPTTTAAELYRRRWGLEVAYRTIKQTLDRAVWLSRTPEMVLAEHVATILGAWTLQTLSFQQLSRQRQDLRRWSPAQARDATRRVMRLALDRAGKSQRPWLTQLGQAIRDPYVRRRSKRARDWPHKKREPPTRPPNLQRLTKTQRQRGQRLLQTAEKS
jgi:Transposase DDE domain